jgi:hypothetical protein
VTFVVVFGGKHSLTATVGVEEEENKNDGIFPPGHEAFLSKACAI